MMSTIGIKSKQNQFSKTNSKQKATANRVTLSLPTKIMTFSIWLPDLIKFKALKYSAKKRMMAFLLLKSPKTAITMMI